MIVPAITLWQPWASLCVTRQPCEGSYSCPGPRHLHGCMADDPCPNQEGHTPPMVKSLETRSRRPPAKLIGQRVLLHAAKRRPGWGQVGSYEVEPWFDPVRHLEDCYCEQDAVAPECARRSPYRSVLTLHEQLVSPLPLGAIVGSAVLGEPLPIVAEGGPFCGPQDPFVIVVGRDGGRARLYRELGAVPGVDITDQLPYGDFTPGRWAWPLIDAAPTTELCPWCENDDTGDGPAAGCPVCDGMGSCEPIPAKGRQQIGWPCDLEAAVTS